MPFQMGVCDGCGEIDYVEYKTCQDGKGRWLCRYCYDDF